MSDKYWKDYYHKDSIVQAYELDAPKTINDMEYLGGDFVVRKRHAGQWDYFGEHREVFLETRVEIEREEQRPIDLIETVRRLAEQADDLSTDMAQVRVLLERYGLIHDPAQK